MLVRRGDRTSEFSRNSPTDWRPNHVRNPDGGMLDTHFSNAAAWELIATKLEAGHPVEVVSLRHPPGKTGYVMKIDLGSDQRLLYVKLQMGSGKVIGRSFHYSEREV